MANDELSRLKSTLGNQGLSQSTRKAIESRIKELEKPTPPTPQPKTTTKSVPVNKGIIKHLENVKSQVETRKNIAEEIISKQPKTTTKNNITPETTPPTVESNKYLPNTNLLNQKINQVIKYQDTRTERPSYDNLRSEIFTSRKQLDKQKEIVTAAPEDSLFETTQGTFITKSVALTKISEAELSLKESNRNIQLREQEGYRIRKTSTGDYEFYKNPSDIEKDLLDAKIYDIKKSMTGDFGQRLAGLGVWTTTGFLSWEDPFNIKSTGQALAGDVEGSIETKAKASIDLDTALKAGVPTYVFKVATGPLATVAAAYGVGAGVKAGAAYALGRATPIIGAAAAKGLVTGTQVGAGLYMGGVAALDIKKTYEKDPALAGAKALTYLGVAYAGYKGSKSVDSKAFFDKGMAKTYSKNPTLKELIPVQEAVLKTSDTRIRGFKSQQGANEFKRFEISQKNTYKPGSKIKYLTNTEYQNTKGPRLDYEIIGQKSNRGLVVDSLKTGEAAGSKTLFKTGIMSLLKGKTGEITGSTGRTIKTFTKGTIQSARDLGPKEPVVTPDYTEIYAGKIAGRILSSKNIITDTQATARLSPVLDLKISPDTAAALGVATEAPVFTITAANVPFTITSNVLKVDTGASLGFETMTKGGFEKPPDLVFTSDLTKDSTLGTDTLTDNINKTDTRIDNITDTPIFDFNTDIKQDIVELTDTIPDTKQDKIQELDFLQETQTPTPPDLVIDLGFNEKPSRYGTVSFRPSGLGLGKGGDMGLGFLTPIRRSRKHRLGDLLEELKRL